LPESSISNLDTRIKKVLYFPICLVYANGSVIKKVTACNYSAFETEDVELGLCDTYCPQADIICPRTEPIYKVPDSLMKRGLQVGSC